MLQSDANVRVRPGYLEAVVREFHAKNAALLGSLVAGRGERSLGAALDNVQLTTFTTPGICLAYRLAGISCVIGKAQHTGGLVTERTVKEQLLYEVHDPAAYLTPDVTADIAEAEVREVGKDRVALTGVRGRARQQARRSYFVI